MKLILEANETRNLTVQGARVYYEAGDNIINVRMIGGADARDFDLQPGQGFVCIEGERFYGLAVTNGDVAQVVELIYSDREVFDNRATISSGGASVPVTVKSSLNRVIRKETLSAGVAKELLTLDLTRKKAALYFSCDASLGVDGAVTVADGYPVTATSDLLDENLSALWAISALGGDVFIHEDKN
jgi:hypothetical protein